MTGGPLCPDMPVKGALTQAVDRGASQEHQAWILRRFLTQVERQEAAGEEEPHSIVGEFAVSPVFVALLSALKVRYHIEGEKFANLQLERYFSASSLN